MVSVQGSYVPAGVAGFFFVWALDPAVEMAPARGRAPRLHPQALGADRLSPLLRGVPYVNTVTCTAHLPEAGVLKPYKLPGLAIAVVNAAQWLLDLDAAFAGLPMKPGQSLKAWSAAAKLVIEEMGRGRFVPLLRAEAGCLAAAWAPCPPEPAGLTRLAQLESALPGAALAVVPPDRSHLTYRLPPAATLLGQFRQAAVEALALRFLQGEPAPALPARGASAVHHWLRALTGNQGRDLPPSLAGAAALFAAVDQWATPVTGVRGHAALRTGLRIHLPQDSEQGGWEAELVLQTADDPPVTVPAQVVWAAVGQDLVVGEQRYQQAEQRLLGDLPAISRLSPSLEPLRFSPAPSRIALSEADVVSLLQEGADLLQQAGFPVMLPAGLVRAGALRTRMHLSPGESESETRFGLSQIVDVQWELALGDIPLTYAELRQLARQKRQLIEHRGRWVQVDEHSLAAALKHLEPYQQKIRLADALRLAPETESTTAAGWVADLLVRLQEPARIEPVAVPQAFCGVLRPYQQRGLDWLAFLRRYGLGACLADDMGLGKTVQLIALLLHEREQGLNLSPTLLVSPVSVVGNWRRELARFAPSLRVLIHHGAGRAAEEAFAAEAARHDVVITTYALVARDEEHLAAVPWTGVVADEAQNLKNPLTRHAQAIRRLPAGYRIGLTGTPVENHLGDLWSLFEFLNPGLLGRREEFRRTYAIPIERYRDAEAAARLRRQVGPLLLRRLKTDPAIIQDLPEKLENNVYATLTVEQAALYEAVVQETLERATAAEGIQRHGAVLAGLTRLKQVCNHPAALAGGGGSLAGRSGKLERLTEMLQEVLEEGDRALIFTQFAQFGARLQPFLARALGCEVLFLDGSTPQKERDRLITRFQAGEAPLFVLSLKAGGVGLNLTAANHVFHFDRWWNPAVEEQATDRAFRIGQTRRVLVHKLVTAGTLEERIDRLLAEKRGLSEQVIGTGEGWLGSLSSEELRDLITLEQEG